MLSVILCYSVLLKPDFYRSSLVKVFWTPFIQRRVILISIKEREDVYDGVKLVGGDCLNIFILYMYP